LYGSPEHQNKEINENYSAAYLTICVMCLAAAVCAFAQYSGVDRCSGAPCANATPCRHCSGTWSGSAGDTWNITTSLISNSVSGTGTIQNSGCPYFTF
jgi:hypothetical protein